MTIQLSVKEAARLGLTEQGSAQHQKKKTTTDKGPPRSAPQKPSGEVAPDISDGKWNAVHEPFVILGWSFRCMGREMQHVAKHWATGRTVGTFQTRRELLKALEEER